MRKLSLLAAAAMVAGGSAFAMDGGGVSISGEANFGVKYNEANDKPGSNALAFHHEFDITFAASGTTDGGIGFGAKVTIDNQEGVKTGNVTAAKTNLLRSITLTTADVDSSNAEITTSAYQLPSDNTDTGDALNTVILTGVNLIEVGDITFVADGAEGDQVEIPDLDPGDVVYITQDGDVVVVDSDDVGKNWEQDGATGVFYQIAGTLDVDSITPASTSAIASSSVDNHAEVYISMDMHKLTIGSDIDAADKKRAGGIADLGFDGIGVDDKAEALWGGTAADARYDGEFGVAGVSISVGIDGEDTDWAAGFSFNVEPVTFGVGFDSKGVMSAGLGFKQGQVSMNALFSQDSDTNEADNEAVDEDDATAAKPERSNAPDLKGTAIGVDVSYQMSDATSVTIAAAQYKSESAYWMNKKGSLNEAEWKTMSETEEAFGIGFAHDLGGGATLKAGAGSVDSNSVADLGITMKF